MFYKEIWEHTEPKSLFLEYLEAQILKISPLAVNHGDVFGKFLIFQFLNYHLN